MTVTCADKILHTLPVPPSVEYLQTKTKEEAFRTLYTSALHHYAHVLFAVERDMECLTQNHERLASKMNTLTCSFYLSTEEAGYSTNVKSELQNVLDTSMTLLTNCTEITHRDCATLGSTLKLLSSLISYIEDNNLASTSFDWMPNKIEKIYARYVFHLIIYFQLELWFGQSGTCSNFSGVVYNRSQLVLSQILATLFLRNVLKMLRHWQHSLIHVRFQEIWSLSKS